MSDTKLPRAIVWLVVATCVVPSLLNAVGVNFGFTHVDLDPSRLEQLQGPALGAYIKQASARQFVSLLLDWTAICTALFTVALAFLHFSMKRDVTTPIIGIALFTAAILETLRALQRIGVLAAFGEPSRIQPLTGAVCQIFTALIFIVGLGTYLLFPRFKRRTNLLSMVLTSIILAGLGWGAVIYISVNPQLPPLISQTTVIKRPLNLVSLVLFVFAWLAIFRPLYQRAPSLFSHALLISVIPQLTTELHLAFGAASMDDNSAIIAKFLHIISYLVPLIGLSLDYVRSYREEELARSQLHRAQLDLLDRTDETERANRALQVEVKERRALEEALRENEERLRTVMSNVPIIIFALDRHGTYVLSEGKGLEALGRKPGEVVGHSIFSVYEGHPTIPANIHRALAGEAFAAAVEINGVHFESRYLPVRDNEGDVVGIIGVSVDISERLRAEEALRQSERKYRDLVETSNDLIWSVDVEGRWTFVNGAARLIYGYEPEEMIGRHFTEFASQEQAQEDRNVFEAVKAGKPRFQYRTRHLRKDGTEVILSFNAILMRSQDGQVVGTTGTASNITERIQTEDQLEQQRVFLRQVIDINPNLIFAKDREGRFTLVNKAVADAYGTTVQNLIGKRDSDFNFDTAQVEHFRRDDLAVMDSLCELFVAEERLTDREGKVRWLQTTKRPLVGADGKADQILGVATDITIRKEAERALQYRLEFEKLITTLSTSFINLDHEEIDQGISRALRQVGEFAGVDRSFVALLTEDHTRASVAYEWHAAAFTALGPHFREISTGAFPWWMEKLKQLQAIHIKRPEDFPPDAIAERRLLEQYGIGSCLVVPMVIGKTVIGFTGLACEGRDERWENDSSALLRLVGEMFANALQRKRAEEALRRSEELYRKFFEEDLSGTFTSRPDGQLVNCNAAFCRIFGFNSVEEALATNLHNLYPTPDEREQFVSIVRENQGLEFYELELKRLDGSIVHVVENAVGIFSDQGELIEIKGFLFDNTERKRAEQKLREHAALLDASQDAIFVLDLSDRITFWNNGAERLYGWPETEVMGRTRGELGLSSASAGPSLSDMLQRGEWRGELTQRTKSGKEVVVDSNWTLVHDEGGVAKSVLAVNTDITEKKRMQLDLLRASKLESIGILAGGIAHDFNNILTAIFGNLSLAKTGLAPSDIVYERVTKAEKAAQRAKDLTQQLLTFAKGGAPIRKSTSISEIIKESAEFSLRGASSRCDFVIPTDLWAVDVDAGQINQVINNLMINAVQAMPDGGVIRVECQNYAHRSDNGNGGRLRAGNYVRIVIRDQGVGIAPENLDKIFDPYFSTKAKGSGLGLATSYSIIKRHQGHIAVESELGRGTTFYVYLPASFEPPQIKEENGFKPIPGKGRVLIMDDDDIVREIAGNMLMQIGYEVEFATNGSDAVKLYRAARYTPRPYDLVIMDLTIPGGMGGKDAIRRMIELDPEVRAIVSSGYSNDPVMADFSSYGFRGVIAKPYELEELSRVIHKVLHDRR